MNGSMLAGAALNFTEARKVAALEVAISVLEFPERSIGIASVEDVAFCDDQNYYSAPSISVLPILTLVKAIHVELPNERGDIGVLEVLSNKRG